MKAPFSPYLTGIAPAMKRIVAGCRIYVDPIPASAQ